MSIDLSSTQPPGILRLLAHEIRWKLLTLLASVEGSAEERLRAFEQTSLQLTTRLRFLLTLLAREHRR